MRFDLPADLTSDERLLVDVLDDLAARRIAAAGALADQTAILDPEVVTLLAAHGFLDAFGDPRMTLLLVERLARASVAVASLPAGLADARAALPRFAPKADDGGGGGDPPFGPLGPERPVLVEGGTSPITASIDDLGWRLDGSSPRVEWAAEGDRMVVIAATADGPAVFEVDPATSGVGIAAPEATTGMVGVPVRAVHLEGVRPVDGRPAGGPEEARRARRQRWLCGAAMAVGVAATAVEAAVAYAGQRRQFGRQLSEFGAIRAMLADMEARITAAAALLWAVGSTAGSGFAGSGVAGSGLAAARAAQVAVAAALAVTCDAVQVHGGYGYIREFPVERCMRDAASIAARTGGRSALLEEAASALLPG